MHPPSELADDVKLVDPFVVHDRQGVFGEELNRVKLAARRRAERARPEAPVVEGDELEPIGESVDLGLPAVAGDPHALNQQNRRSGARNLVSNDRAVGRVS